MCLTQNLSLCARSAPSQIARLPLLRAQCVRDISGLDTSDVLAYLSKCELPFEKSLLYSSATETKFIDESLRSSSFRVIVDNTLFDMLDAILAPISAADDAYEFAVRRNDARTFATAKAASSSGTKTTCPSPRTCSRSGPCCSA